MRHKFEIGQKVVFIKKSNKEYAWSLKKYNIYEIKDIASDFIDFSTEKIYYYSVNYDNKSSWYIENDFIDLKEYRKLKLKKLNEKLIY